MKVLIFCFSLLFLSFMSKGQVLTTKKNGGEKQSTYFFASAGVSMPQGYITDDDVTNLKASAGPFITVGCHYFFHKRWGMGLETSVGLFQSVAVERLSYITQKVYYSASPKGNWQKAQLHLNFSYTPILRKRWAIDIIQGFSINSLKRPAYDYSYSGSYYANPAHREWEWNYMIGVRGRILITDRMALLAGTSYSHDFGNGKPYEIGFDVGNFELGVVVNLK